MQDTQSSPNLKATLMQRRSMKPALSGAIFACNSLCMIYPILTHRDSTEFPDLTKP